MVEANEILAFDFETTGVDRHRDTIVGFSVSDGQISYYVPTAHIIQGHNAPENLWRPLMDLIATKRLLAHNALFELGVAARAGWQLNIEADTMLMTYCVGTFLEIGLKAVVEKMFGYKMTEYKQLFDAKDKTKQFNRLPVDVAEAYAAEDAYWTYKLWRKLDQMLSGEPRKVYSGLEMGIMPYVKGMEDFGLYLNQDYMRTEAKRLLETANKVEQIWYYQVAQQLKITAAQARANYGINSTSKLVKLLYGPQPAGLGLKPLKQTKAGGQSTDESALKTYRNNHPIVANLLNWRELMASHRAYAKIVEMVHADGRLRANINQTGASSGRFGSSNPNVQNWAAAAEWDIYIPVKQDDGSVKFLPNWKINTVFRRSLVAPQGYKLFEFDFSQIEYRIMAGVTKCQRLLDLYEQNEDMHVATYAFCFRIPKDQVTKKQRRVGKTINFALVYGMGVDHFYRELKGEYTREQVAQIHARYFEMLPELVAFHDETRRRTDQTHTVDTYFGRHQLIPEYLSENPYERSKARRAGVNRIIQGTAADVMKIAIKRVGAMLKRTQKYARVEMILTIHDALMFYIPLDIDLTEFAFAIKKEVELKLPGFPTFTIDFKAGDNWGDADDFHVDDALAPLTTVHIPDRIAVTLPDDVTAGTLRSIAELLTGSGPLSVELILRGKSNVKATSVAYSVVESRLKSIPGVAYSIPDLVTYKVVQSV